MFYMTFYMAFLFNSLYFSVFGVLQLTEYFVSDQINWHKKLASKTAL